MTNFSQINLIPRILKSSHPKIGVIILSTDFTIEQDIRNICYNQNVDIYVNRIPFNNPLNHENYLKMFDHLAEKANNILPGKKIDSIVYGCTAGTVAIGYKKVVDEIHKSKPGSYVTTPITAALKAFTKLKVKKTIIITGELFFTPPMVDHAMKFLEYTEFITLGKGSRTKINYDKDTHKIILI